MTDVLHGYTLHDLNGLAKSAAITASPSAAGYDDRYDEAWSAIVEHLFTVEQPPTGRDLWYAGLNAVRHAGATDRRHHGASSSGGYNGPTGASDRFAQYWSNTVTHDFSGAVIDRYAAFQIWPQLADIHQQTLLALAAAGDIDGAAVALGVTVRLARQRVSRARAAFRALWHEHETPPPFWHRTHSPVDKAGLKPCGTPAAWSRHKRRGEPVDQACAEANRVYMRQWSRGGPS
ncbi:hypothetical protein Ait01nite_031890 [Actinoplanes italicus]|uniref:Uncharacterized protein n=1 Tax=Actinoplanes italicus TaxID=113567 RepID=A0A2T0KJF4_9ACTN|nr:hypothetical protein [Actinoplanes italicus]PRX23644.1 hypothetical protein CLV67_103393 [Actinoplanes italicus]GIE30144.1 hypothetical protein Ait01nite_031890 [Actinoplanes italicus]